MASYLSKAVFFIAAWSTFIGVLSAEGFFSDFMAIPPRIGMAMIVPFPFIILLSFSRSFSTILKVTPVSWLVAFQSFRIFVEILLLICVIKKLLPVQMSFEGYNFDILSGLFAIPVAKYLAKHPASNAVLVYNIVGLLLLANIVVIAMLSAPTPFRYFMNEPANTLVARFPFIYIPGVLVVAAYSFHIFSLRQYWLLRKA